MKSFFSLEVDLICDAHERVESSRESGDPNVFGAMNEPN